MHDTHSFTPPLLLRNAHVMTLASGYWPRDTSLSQIPKNERLFTTDPGTQLLGICHWQDDRSASPTIILVHGLEGCADSHYMRGIADKAYRQGFNVVRMNQRTCGCTEQLTPTLYNSGLSSDYREIVRELASVDRLTRIWLAGYSRSRALSGSGCMIATKNWSERLRRSAGWPLRRATKMWRRRLYVAHRIL